MSAQRVARRAAWAVMFLSWLVAGCQTTRPMTAPPAAPPTDADRSFLVWKIKDSGTAQVLIQACGQKRVGAELKSLCADMAHTRALETEIASRYLGLLYGETLPPARQSWQALTSKDGAKFATGFLKSMIQQDEEGRQRTRACLIRAGREEIKTFCHLVERSRWAEVQLLENQRCQTNKNCKWKPSEEWRNPILGVPRTVLAEFVTTA